jgi:chromate transporter
MHRIIVEEKRWFLHALNYCMLLPGPEAQQLATYIGWLMHRLGGLLAGGLFILPGIICIMVLSYVYALWGRAPAVTALFFGLKAAVLAIVIEAVIRIGKRALKSRSLKALAAVAFVGIFFFAVPFPFIILAAALLGLTGVVRTTPLTHRSVESASGQMQQSLLGDEPPEHANATVGRTIRVAACWLALWLTPVIALLIMFGAQNVFSQIAVFFSKMAMVTFGGAYAVGLNAALSNVTAAVVGVVLNLAIWFAIHTIFGATVQVRTWPLAFDAPVLSSLDPWALGLTLAAAFAMFRLNWGMIPTLASSCATGVALHLLGVI